MHTIFYPKSILRSTNDANRTTKSSDGKHIKISFSTEHIVEVTIGLGMWGFFLEIIFIFSFALLLNVDFRN